MRDLEPITGHLKTKLALGAIGIVWGAYMGAVYAINNILLGGLHVR